MSPPLHIACATRADASLLCSRAPTRLSHAAHELALFGDDALARLLERYPREHVVLQAMDRSGAATVWQQGCIGDASGEDVLRTIRRGTLWLNLKALHEHEPEYAALLDAIYVELAALAESPVPKWRTMGLLISSPGASVPYHSDTVTNILWQIRGRKRVHVYPPRAPFLAQRELERICAGVRKEEIPYDPSFDAHAIVAELGPGEALLWPQHSPHRVSNLDGLNISLSTEHLVPEARRLVRVHRANHTLRAAGLRPRSVATRGLAARAKAALACVETAWRRLRVASPVRYDQTPRFVLDPSAPDGIRT